LNNRFKDILHRVAQSELKNTTKSQNTQSTTINQVDLVEMNASAPFVRTNRKFNNNNNKNILDDCQE